MSKTKPCPDCGGSGRINIGVDGKGGAITGPCGNCGGSGRVPA